MSRILRIHENDNVAVVLDGVQAGTTLQVNGTSVTAREAIAPGHKIALKPIAEGTNIMKYGWPIGCATAAIAPGAWVHTHNVRTNLEGLLDYCYEPEANLTQLASARAEPAPAFLGYRRPDGRVGVRNELWIVVTVGCVNAAAQNLARLANAQMVGGSIEGCYAFTHPFGCGQIGEDLKNTQRLLAALMNHPNCAGVLVMGLGCENNAMREQIEMAGEMDPRRVRFFNAQEVEDEIECGMKALEELAEYARTFQRESCPAADLVLGQKCGGSDGFSGITANPLVGRVSEMVIGWGGTAMITEVPEMFGAERILMNRCRDEATFEATVRMINGFKQYFIENHQPVYENPALGNKEGGITTLEEKSLGCIQKGGHSVVTQVLGYAERVTAKGLALVTAPGYDLVSSTALVASGAQIVLFTTGRGTPFGTPAPTLKIATNTMLAKRKPNWIDFDAGRLLSENADPAVLAKELMQLVLDTASGKVRARNETNGMREIAVFKTGVIV